jgi:signal transduction histidine kinase
MQAKGATAEELRNVYAFRDLPDEMLEWVIEKAEYAEFNDGELIVGKDQPIDHMWILLSGSAHFYLDVNGSMVHYYNFENDEASGGVGGILPYSRMTKSPGYSYASGQIRSLLLHKRFFPELEKRSNLLIQRLISSMTNRARVFATIQLQQEKVSALGKLSAGIAHELNNPASAINRISHELTQRLVRNFDLTEKLLYHGVNHEHIHLFREILKERISVSPMTSKLPPVKRMELEDDTRDWLENRKIPHAAELSEAFVEMGVTIMELEQICELTGIKACADVLIWLENHITSQKIINDLEHASERISKLVGAVKSHVHMDRSSGIQTSDLRSDIENTLTLLGHKIREKSITIDRQYAEGLPMVECNPGELNQVWMNLVDNAIYAMSARGKLIIRLYPQNDDMKIHIIDDGQGISKEALPRIFDPFFTTKKVGEGTGIGLDLVHRIVKKHNGDIKVTSAPGCTEFVVCLPLKQPVSNTP